MTQKAVTEQTEPDFARTPPPRAGGAAYPRKPIVAVTLFLFGSLVAAIYTFGIYPRQSAIDPVIDVNRFGVIARHIAAGDGFSQGWGPTVRRAPLYPAIVALTLRIFGQNGPDAVVFRPMQAVQCLILGLTCVVVWCAARKLFGPRAALIAGVLAAVAPQSLRYIPMTEVETCMGLAIALMALTSVNLALRPTPANGVLLGLAAGAATLIKPIAAIYPAVFGIALVLAWRNRPAAERRQPGPVAAALCSLVVLVGTVAPWIVRNAIVSQGAFFGLSSNASGEFLRGYVLAEPRFFLLKQNVGGSDPGGHQWDWDANLLEDALLRRHGTSVFSVTRFGPHGELQPVEERVSYEVRKDRIESAEVKRRILHEPRTAAFKVIVQLFTFWYIVETRTKSLVVGGIAAVAIAMALFGFARARRRGLIVYPVVTLLLYQNIVYAVFLGLARYSMPLFPTLLILSAYGCTQLFASRTEHSA
jgi:4-amino-4-deoxy-L-arabinose transferase-like glycosyltransferase